MLTIRSVSKRFKAGNYGVRDLSLSVDGGVLGLLGANGAGKTTLMQLVATIMRPTRGEISFQGLDILEHPEALRRRLGYLPQSFGVYPSLTAEEFLSYLARLKGHYSRSAIQEMLERVNLHEVGGRQLAGFSGGMRQRLGIAQALIGDPDLVIVDEPTAGLDPGERVRFRNLLAELATGKLIILSTHIVSDIESIATKIAVIRQGSLIRFDTPERLLRSAEGQVWQAVVPSQEFERIRDRLTVSRAAPRSDGVHLRLIHPTSPLPQATPAPPTLEDAYLGLIQAGAGDAEITI
jgi:ABC-type multidrug transport system ATPase subunit